MSEEQKDIGGRPPMYESPEVFQECVQAYFDQFTKSLVSGDFLHPRELNENRPTITGLSLFLGFESRQSFYDYEKKEEFAYTVKRARHMIENIYENMLGGQSTTGAIFALKNFGWEDKSQFDHTSNGEGIGPFSLIVKKTDAD